MKKLFIGFVLMLLFSVSALAGNLYVNDPTFEDGSNDYNGSALIDADTLNGETGLMIVNPVWSYIGSKESSWSKDNVGSYFNNGDLEKRLVGYNGFFSLYDTFVDYLNTLFVPRSVYDADIAKLNARFDMLEADNLGVSIDVYQKQKAIETGHYGSYSCDSDVCLKRVN